MRRLLKFLHTMGAIGFIGAMLCFVVLLSFTPTPTSQAPASLSDYAVMRGAMGGIAKWVFMPSLGVTLIAGLLSIAFNPAFHNAGWAWAKLASGILIFEYGFTAVQGPMQEEAELSAKALAGGLDPATLATTVIAERNSLWILLAVATANVVLGIWRPRFTKLPE